MRIDTEQCRTLSASFRSLQEAYVLPSHLYTAKLTVSNSIDRLANYFSAIASQAEAVEQSRALFQPGEVITSHHEYWNLGRQLQKLPAKTTFTGSLAASWKTASLNASYKDFSCNGKLDLVKANLKGTASVQLWNEEKFEPKVDIGASGSLSAASATVSAAWNPIKGVSAIGYAKGEVGAVYGKAEAVISKEELSIEGSVGAAALRGECSLSFSLLGTMITITGQGSLGSAEAGFSYHHKNKEWEFGSKLGFIAGLGFKIKINY